MRGDVPPPSGPSLGDIRAARSRLEGRIRRTPTLEWTGPTVDEAVEPGTRVFLKLELFQHAGTFKPRAALLHLLDLDRTALERGVTAVSAGNHALAVAFAAAEVGTTAKVVMPSSADPHRIEGCRQRGAEVVLVDDIHQAFPAVERIRDEEGRFFVHPFEGETVALGTGGVGVELMEDVPNLDAVIVPIGGGGLCAGIAAAVRQIRPDCEVWGVEPEGADTMHRSFAAGTPQPIDRVRTIADSLGAPHALPYSFGVCRHWLEGLVRVNDDQLRSAMRRILVGAKLAVEPAGAAATAALVGPLRSRLAGKRVGLIVCGSNISPGRFAELVSDRGTASG